MKPRTVYWLALPVLTGLLSYYVVTGQLHRLWSSATKSDPVIDYPSQLDLGEQEYGDQATARFSIANRGGGTLVIDEIKTNCSCSGMEREESGRHTRVESLRLKAGERAELVMRVSVRGAPVGAAMINVLEFQTNDPTQPSGRIEVVVRRVSGGVTASPRSVVIGTVPVK